MPRRDERASIKTIKSGKTLSVGELVNSLQPSKDQWGLHFEKPSANAQPVQPSINGGDSSKQDDNNDFNSNASITSDELKVNLLALYGKMKFAKHLMSRGKRLLKKEETDLADAAVSDAETVVKTEVETTDAVEEEIIDTALL